MMGEKMNYISKKITNFAINKDIISMCDKDVFQYGLILIIEIIVDFIGYVLIGLAFNCLLEMAVFLSVFAILRANAGGYHAKSAISCFVTSVTFCLLSIYLTKVYPSNNLIFCIIGLISFIIIYLYAPVDSKAKRLSDYRKKICRRSSFITIILLYIILLYFRFIFINEQYFTSISMLAILVQCLSMLPILNTKKDKEDYQ